MTKAQHTPGPIERLHRGPFTGSEASDGFTDPLDEEAALQEEADFYSAAITKAEGN